MKINMNTTKDVGRFGENAACDYLKSKKYKIIKQNYFASHNEIDIIAENKQYIVFIEVKARALSSNSDFGSPASAVTYSKQKRTLAAAQAYLKENPTKKSPRLDVIEVYLLRSRESDGLKVVKINHIEDAFSG